MVSGDPDCVFCAIAAGTLPAHLVYEDEDVVAFLDRGPIRPGHTQIVPRRHVPHFDDLPADLLVAIILAGQKIARAQKRTWGVERCAFLFTGGDIAHAHAHVVPMVAATDITSRRYIANADLQFRPMPQPPHEEMAGTAARLRELMD